MNATADPVFGQGKFGYLMLAMFTRSIPAEGVLLRRLSGWLRRHSFSVGAFRRYLQ